MNEEKTITLCDLCNEKESTIWWHSDGGCGTPLRSGFCYNFCKDCYNERDSEIRIWKSKKRAESHKKCVESLKNNIYNKDMRSGMVHYTQMYWFKHESSTFAEFEDYLGFKLPDWFCQWIQNLTCDQCKKKIKKRTKREHDKILQRLNPNGLSLGELFCNQITEYCKIQDALQDIFVGMKFLKSYPESPKQSNSILENQFDNYLDDAAYQKLYNEYLDSKVLKHFCSKKCLGKAVKKDKELRFVLF